MTDTERWDNYWTRGEECDLRGQVGTEWPTCPTCGKGVCFESDNVGAFRVRGRVHCDECGWELQRPARPAAVAWLIEEALAADAARRLGDEELMLRIGEVVPQDLFGAWVHKRMNVEDFAEVVRIAVSKVNEVFALGATLRGLVRRFVDLELRMIRLEAALADHQMEDVRGRLERRREPT